MLFKVAGIAILLAFYGCHFAKMISQGKKGIKTNQMGKGKTGFVKAVECTLGVATILVPIAEVVSIVLGTTYLPMWARIAGAVIGASGVAIFISAVLTMRDSWRAGVSETDKTELVTNGIFNLSRNPAFLGFDLVYLGILLMFFNWVLLLLSCFAALMLHLQIVNVEEDHMLITFGDDYLKYKKRVNRYIGRKKFKEKIEFEKGTNF